MRKIELGKTGVMVSEFSLGCMLMGTSVDEKSSYELLDTYVEMGGNFLDTANNYAFWVEDGKAGASETLLGKWMKERKNRSEIILATKVGADPVQIENIEEDFLGSVEGLSKATVINAVNASLKRLQTDYIDLLYIHIDDRSVALEETLEALNILIYEGKVKHIGCSNLQSWRIQEAKGICHKNNWVSFSAIQQSHTYIKPRFGSYFQYNVHVDESLIDFLQYHNDMTLVAYSPLLGGYYASKEKRDNYWRKHLFDNTGNESRLEALRSIAQKHGASENQVVLAWMRSTGQPAIPIIGARKKEHLIENIHSSRLKLTPEDIKILDES